MNNSGRSRGAGGRGTPCPRDRSSNRSHHGSSGWKRVGEFSSGGNWQESREISADDISERLASFPPLGNQYRHDDSPQSTPLHVANPVQVQPKSSIEKQFPSPASRFKQNDSSPSSLSSSSCLSLKECSPITSTLMTPESVRAADSGSESNSGKSESLDQLRVGFDICQKKVGNVIKLKAPLHVKNREKRNEIKRNMGVENIEILSNGMVLLKSFISMADQLLLVNICRKLGIGPGGFYQPGYRDGAKLHLKMMCLGKNWDPETSQYGEIRPFDGAKPPMIPDEFRHLVQKAIEQSRSYLEKHSKRKNIDDVLPSMLPNICLANFYTTSGKLGLHQDKDESQESINRGLPVVSFSIGDAAEFLYSDQKDPEKANKVMLESGDVLIFGGKSRLIYHGVSSIKPNTAPTSLLDDTNLKQGRLNLTFRQY